tara:strand:- start:8183 stop:9283 length:1101 start_codon:yes stop_codon:yes gene_type:complete
MANYTTYIGQRKSLKFPVMCDGYVSLAYADNVATSSYGVWDIDDSFTFQCIITPYDVNGNSYSPVLTSDKTMPWGSSASGQDQKYLPDAKRLTHKMVIFHNENFELFLENTTNRLFNQPAEYKIGMRVKLTNEDTLYSNKVIVAKQNHSDMRNINDMYSGTQKIRRYIETVTYNAISESAGVSNSVLEIVLNTNASNWTINVPVYDYNNKYIGDVLQIDADPNNATLHIGGGDADYTHTLFNTTNKKLYTEPLKEPLYVIGTNHIACSFDNATGQMSIMIDGTLIASKIHKDKKTLNVDFNMGDSNISIGQNPSATTPRYTQFMGEIHEMAMSTNLIFNFPSIYTLFPQRKNLMMYLNFEGGEKFD